MDLLKLLHGFVHVVITYEYVFLAFAKQTQAEV